MPMEDDDILETAKETIRLQEEGGKRFSNSILLLIENMMRDFYNVLLLSMSIIKK